MVDLAERAAAGEVPTGYRMTELGLLPADWSVARLADVAEFSKKERGADIDGSIPFIPMTLLPESALYVDHWEDRARDEVRSGVYFQAGDLLLAKITPCLENGKQGIARGISGGWGYATTEVYPIHGTAVLTEYLAYYLRHQPVRSHLVDRMEGSTGRQRLPKSVVENLPIPLPPLPEQRAIAHVLSTVQRAREATEAVIASTRELKRSLMRHLFMYGPVPVDQVDGVRLKETEIGLVPEHWQPIRLESIAQIASGGTPDRGRPDFWSGGIPWVKTGEINYNAITTTEETISAIGLACSSARIMPAGAVLMAMYGQGITRGRVAMLGIDAAVNQACLAIMPNSRVLSLFLYHYLTYRYDAIRDMAHGANQKNLNAGMVKSMMMPLTSMAEQEIIVRTLSAVDKKLTVEHNRKRVLDATFTGLLRGLMTGKKRVPVHTSR